MSALIDKPFAVLVVLCGIALLAKFLDGRFAFARKLTPVILILIISALCSNLRLIPFGSEKFKFYSELNSYLVPMAVCLVLFRINLASLKDMGLPMVAAFVIACVGTFVGTVVATLALSGELTKAMAGFNDPNLTPWNLAGPYAATYIGGSLNFNALWQAKIGSTSGDAFGVANAVDNLTAAPFFLFLQLVPAKLMRWYPVAKLWGKFELKAPPAGEAAAETRFKLLDFSALIFSALLIILVCKEMKAAWKLEDDFFYLALTTLALLVAQHKGFARLDGANELGNYAFYIFFAAVGATCDVVKAVKFAPILFCYVAIIIGIHVLIVFGVGRLFRLDARVLAIASMATKSGPPTVVALASATGWKELLLPGVAAGLLGYAVGNYFGFAAVWLTKWMLGG